MRNGERLPRVIFPAIRGPNRHKARTSPFVEKSRNGGAKCTPFLLNPLDIIMIEVLYDILETNRELA